MLPLLALLAVAVPTDTITFVGDVGFVNTSGNTELTTLNVGDKLTFKSASWGVVQSFGVIYGTNDGEVSTSIWRGALRADRELAPRLAFFVLSEFERNVFAGLGSRYGESAGLLMKLIADERDKLSVEAGVGYVWQNATPDGVDQEFSAGRAALNFQHALSEKAFVTQLLECLPNFKVGDDLRINSETSLTAPIAAGIAMKASYVIRHDGLPELGFEKTDRILTTGLQVTF